MSTNEKRCQKQGAGNGQMWITYEIAMAAGRDAGNRSMKAAGRAKWNEEDWDAACAETERLAALITCRGPGGREGMAEEEVWQNCLPSAIPTPSRP
jgi:hypothetical protein